MNYREIKELIDLIKETDVAEIELERSGTRIRIRREKKEPVRFETREIAVAPRVEAREEAAPPSPAVPLESGIVRSPLVGTFYRAPGPDTRSFVEEEDRVEKGQVLCIVEAMKLMNEIEAEYSGMVREILVENGQPVEYGQPLFRIESDA
jgi:acetyl-CoA carboxylase biotin carboxyl carrier protein